MRDRSQPPQTSWWDRVLEIGSYRIDLPRFAWTGRLFQRVERSWLPNSRRFSELGLLRLVLVAAEQQLPLATIVAAWADAESSGQRWRIRKLAERLRRGSGLTESLEGVPGLVSDETLLAIRCGVQTGTLPQTLRQLVSAAEAGHERPADSPRNREFWAYAIGEIGVIALVLTFIVVKLIPGLKMIGRDLGAPPETTLSFFDFLALPFDNYFSILILLAIGLGWAFYSGLLSRVGQRLTRNRASWLGQLRELIGRSNWQVLRLLIPSLAAGRPLPAAISSLARYHAQPSLRHDLLYVRNEVEMGEPAWQALRQIGQINGAEEALLSSATCDAERAWLLGRLVDQHETESMWKRERTVAIVQPLVVLLLSLVVLATGWAVLSTLASYISVTGEIS